MPWRNDPEARSRSNATYRSAEYVRNRQLALQRAGYRCQIRAEGCTARATQVDHVIPVSRGGTHVLNNLRATCKNCHAKKTAEEGNNARQGLPADPEPQPRERW